MTQKLEKLSVDATDRRILAALQNYPDSSIAELGEIVGLSQTPCWRRLRRLQDAGAIRERVWILDPARLGISVNVFVEIKLQQHDETTLLSFEGAIHAIDEVVECFSMSGDCDYLLRMIVSDIARYERILKKSLLHLPGLASVNSSFALQAVKVTTRIPLDDIAG
ncbi:Lrp/AsnC family transcriptional regulator [Novosphingobium sp. P6W]|uniref:Lrp/AsnC family transcriptional regulator n=1 Tax=Novosphingobium sp. P6W TaxID=1609758 RepID=UPI0005C2C06F|nr:Lrp/AsnC family transcriptional regulator [Novosphingobium sp. P6W]AXB78859.1 Lrp/AsnC family transcriptional regulator [Novosphingobium sp. P6W]KIS30151.1 AsnC family transcriptional regulator [Novosphingobium sp. P6W]